MGITDKHLLAKQAREKGDYAFALELIEELLEDDPDDPSALFLLGGIFIDTQRRGLAYSILARCCALAPDRPEVWNNFARCQNDDPEGWELTERYLFKALELKPNMRAALENLASLEIQRCNPEKSMEYVNQCLELYPGDKIAESCKGFASFMLGKWEDGFKNYHSMLGHRSRPQQTMVDEEGNELPEWDGTEGKTVIVHGEQGIGDELVYSSLIQDMAKKCKHVIYDCMPRLKGLMARSMPENVIVTGSRWEEEIALDVTPDCNMTIAGTGMFLRKTDDDFNGKPYLKADPDMRKAIRGLLDGISDRPKIGIAWTGGTKKSRCQFRQKSLDMFTPFLRVQGVDFISLQYKDFSNEIEKYEKDRGIKIHSFPWITEEKDYDLTAALVAELDLVIAVPTSATQLAGALGTEAWVLVPEITGWLFYRDKYVWSNYVKPFHNWTPKTVERALKMWLKREDKAVGYQ